MKGIWKASRTVLFILGVLITLGYSLNQAQPATPPYTDNFEEYTTDSQARKAYTAWDGGAVMEVSLHSGDAPSQSKSLGIRILSPNLQNQSGNGSIYHLLPGNQRNWSGASGIRFRVNNTSEFPLALSLNFKESYNEYWAVAQAGVFFLEADDGSLLQQDIAYSNLVIPENYSGSVIVPFFSFEVPDWNTARGNRVMDLRNIETFALGVNIGQVYPQFFTIDDIEVLPPRDFKTLKIHGINSIQVPPTGEHHERYTATYGNPGSTTPVMVDPKWSILAPQDSSIKLDSSGNLTIPAGIKYNRLVLAAEYGPGDKPIRAEYFIKLAGQDIPAEEIDIQATPTALPPPVETSYDLLSRSFETWAVQNRTLFVVASVGLTLMLVALLSYFQQRLK